MYKATEMKVAGPGKAELVFTAEDGTETRELIHEFKGAGVIQGQHNLDDSIESFAHSCFKYALDTKQDLWFATKDTISKKYDHTFISISSWNQIDYLMTFQINHHCSIRKPFAQREVINTNFFYRRLIHN